MKSLANEFFSTMADGAKQHQAAHAGSYDLIVNGIKNETDLAEQVNLIEQMVAQRVDAMVDRTGRFEGRGHGAEACAGRRNPGRQHRQQAGRRRVEAGRAEGAVRRS